MAVIAVEDVATDIGRPISDDGEYAQVDQWISDVEMLIEAKLGDLTLLNQPMLAYVERQVLVARMRNRRESNDTTSDNVDQGNENFFLNVLAPWWSLLAPEQESNAATASIRPSFEPDYYCGSYPNLWWTVSC